MKKYFLPFLVVIWAGLLIFYLSQVKINIPLKTNANTANPIISSDHLAFVKRVVDGDTIELSTGEKVRYIGMNTPETVDPRKPVECFGKEASNENKKLVEGKTVRLVKDVSEKDKYQRLLRYVYVDNIFVNDYLVRNGFAQVSTFPPDVRFQKQFLEAQTEAQINKRGLWLGCQLK